MQITKTYYGLKDSEFVFTENEVKDALLEYLLEHHQDVISKAFETCDICISEGFEEEKPKVGLTLHNKKLESRESEDDDISSTNKDIYGNPR